MIGETVSHYKILDKLGAGGMGEVYDAEDLSLGRRVALKILPHEMAADPERLTRFRREARTVASLNHPNIVTVYSVEDWEDGCFITMELVRGQSLEGMIKRPGLPLKRFFRIAVPLADALAAAHAQGITHRDLKPANIMVTADDLISSILRDSPRPVSELNAELPNQLGRLIKRCLEKEPERRYQSALDLRNELEELEREIGSSTQEAMPSMAVLPFADLSPEKEQSNRPTTT